MKIITPVMILFLLSFAFLGACSGAVLFEGYTPQEPQEIRLNMQHIENKSTPLPAVWLTLSETEPHMVNLTIIVSTAALLYQTSNFATRLSIDSQEPEKLDGILESRGSRLGDLYSRQYYVTLSGLGDGAHFIKIRVAGDYYGPDYEGLNYDCQGNVSFVIDSIFPTVDNISIKNIIYYENDLELACTTSEPCPWIAYSLDNQANVTMSGTSGNQQAKTNLTDLSEGRHTITIYASDIAGNTVASETITFTVEPFPTTTILAVVLAVTIIVAAAFLFFRRRRLQH